MALKFKRRSRISPEIGMTPLIDCAFNLLLFFAVTLTISTQPTGVKIKTAAGKTAQTQSPDVTVTIKARGRALAYYNDEPVYSQTQLRGFVRAEKGDAVSFLVQPEKNVQYKKLMAVVDAIRDAGGSRAGVSLAMEKIPDKEKDNEKETDSNEPPRP